MTTIVIGTTPTIIYSFSTVAPSDFVKAEFTIMGHNTVLLTKQMSDATIKENQIMWKLTQKDTLSLGTGSRTMMCNWLTADGTRGASKEESVNVVPNHIKEVMT